MFADPWLNFSDEFTELMDETVEERDFFLWSRNNPPGTVETEREVEVRSPGSIWEMFCDECNEFEMRLGGIGDATYCEDCWDELGLQHQSQLEEFETDHFDRGVYALVQCGKSKKEGKHPARELYDSTYFEKKREFAEQLTDQWWIVSALYGVIDPDRVIESYDRKLGRDVPVEGWLNRVEAYLDNEVEWAAGDEVWVLVGSSYLDQEDESGRSLRNVLNEMEPEFRYPFDQTSGIGEQLQYLDKAVEVGEPVMPYTLEEEGRTALDSF